MPRKKVVPTEEPEQVNDMETQVQEESTESLEQPTDVSQEEVSLPAGGEETPQPDPLPQDTDVPRQSRPLRAWTPGRTGRRTLHLWRRSRKSLWMYRRKPLP